MVHPPLIIYVYGPVSFRLELFSRLYLSSPYYISPIHLALDYRRQVYFSAFRVIKLWSVIQKHNLSFKFWSHPSALMQQINHPSSTMTRATPSLHTNAIIILFCYKRYSTYLKWRVSIICVVSLLFVSGWVMRDASNAIIM